LVESAVVATFGVSIAATIANMLDRLSPMRGTDTSFDAVGRKDLLNLAMP